MLLLQKKIRMLDIKNISIDAYDYPLPEDRIAKYPLAERDASKLLVLKDGQLQTSQFKHIGDFLPQKALLVFNETKVIRARLQFQKETGSHIEVFAWSPKKTTRLPSAAPPLSAGNAWWATPSVGARVCSTCI